MDILVRILRVIFSLIFIRLGILFGVAALLLLAWAGAEGVYYFHGRPADLAVMAGQRNLDLAQSSGSLAQLNKALGTPNKPVRNNTAANADLYSWYHDEAVRALVLDDTPVSITIGDISRLRLLPYRRPVFPGSFLGLRIGAPPPSPAEAAALQARATQCCDAKSLTWDVEGGRISQIRYERDGYYYRVIDPPKGG
jgi:hypothetical protein